MKYIEYSDGRKEWGPTYDGNEKYNYLNLTNDEISAMKKYLGRGFIEINLLFCDSIETTVNRFNNWNGSVSKRSRGTIISRKTVNDAINLYSAMLKSYKFSVEHDRETPYRLYRGTTDNPSNSNHSAGFKSFTADSEMVEKFTIFGSPLKFSVSFPENIPYIHNDDLYYYCPNQLEKKEDEYIISPFTTLEKRITIIGNKRPYDELKKDENIVLTPCQLTDQIMEDMENLLVEYEIINDKYKILCEYYKNSGHDDALTQINELSAELHVLSKKYKVYQQQIETYIRFVCKELENEIKPVKNDELEDEIENQEYCQKNTDTSSRRSRRGRLL